MQVNYNKYIILFLLLFFSLSNIQGQKFKTLSAAEKNDMIRLAVNKIKDLGETFKSIPKFKDKSLKQRIINRTIKQFVEGATIEVAGRKIDTFKISYYLNNKLVSYGKKNKIVNVSFVSFKIGELKPLPRKPGMYYIDYEFVQQFCRSDDGKRNAEGLLEYDYCDETKKKGRFILKREHTIIGAKWKLYFDSIKVVSVKVLKRKK